MNANPQRPPAWNKSMTRYLGHGAAPTERGAPSPVRPRAPSIPSLDPAVLAELGLKSPPTDSRLLAAYLETEDLADGELDAGQFARGIRRAVRLKLAFSAKLHRQAGQTWAVWVRTHFKAGYECYHRYHRAAELQVGLISRGLPLLTNENQSRALAPFRRHEKFWDAVAVSFKEGFPTAPELRQRLQQALGVEPKPASSTPRIKLHRILTRVVQATPPGDDPTVGQALALVRQAIAILEKGITP